MAGHTTSPFLVLDRNRFAAAKPLLYLPGRTPNSDFDVRDRRRHLWTHQELARFGDVVETRTQELLELQERLLRSWHDAATQVEKAVRGFIARRRVTKLLDAIANAANQLERAKHFVWLLKKQLAAALIVQRAYRRHVAYLIYVDRCRARLQRATRLFLFRRERVRAACKIQRLFRSYTYRRAVFTHLRRLCKLLRIDRQNQQLEQFALVFTQAQCQRRHHHQELLWKRYPEKMAQLKRVQQQKAAFASLTLPALAVTDPRKRRRKKATVTETSETHWSAEKANGTRAARHQVRSLNQVPSLPPLSRM